MLVRRASRGLRQRVAALRQRVAALRRAVAGLPTRVTGLPQHMAGLPARAAGLPACVAGLSPLTAGLPHRVRPVPALMRESPFWTAGLRARGIAPEERTVIFCAAQADRLTSSSVWPVVTTILKFLTALQREGVPQMSNDYIPSGDAGFNTWQDNFINNLNAFMTELGLTSADISAITGKQSEWSSAYSAHVAAKSAAEGALQAKQEAREGYESALRSMAKRVQSGDGTTDRHRAELGLTVQQGTRTPTGMPETRPVAQVDTSQRLRHTISFSDEGTPNSRAKPAGVMGCEIWSKVGDPGPTDPDQLQFLGLDTSTPYMVQFGGGDAGKTAYYMLRWVNTKGEQGPWSQTVSATVTG